MPPLAEFQARLRDALLTGPLDSVAAFVAADAAADPILQPVERLQIHANNVVITLADALAANFPVTARITGDVFFASAAAAYVRTHPPRARSLIGYGAGFPEFIAAFRGATALPYLADIARLDWACHAAYHGPEALPLSPAALAAVPQSAWPSARFALHPTVALLRSAYPIDAIWRAHQPDAPADWSIDLDAGPAQVIVARPHATVEVLGVPAGLYTLVAELAADGPLDHACARAAAADPDFDPATALAACIANALFTSVRTTATERA